jgi:hypothetical protein
VGLGLRIGAALTTLAVASTTVVVVATSSASCTSGGYDGSTYDAAAQSVSIATTPGTEAVLRAKDGVFEVTIPAGAFAGPATVSITSLGVRTIDGEKVPAFAVSADAKLVGVVAVRFISTTGGSGGSPGVPTALVGIESASGQFDPLPIGVQSNSVFAALSKSLGTFSIVQRTTRNIVDTSGSCIAKCCTSSNSGLSAVGASCHCQLNGSLLGDDQAFRCFLACPLDEAATRCESLGSEVKSFACAVDGGVASGNGPLCGATSTGGGFHGSSICCIQRSGGSFPVLSCYSNQACPGFTARCTDSAQCPAGTTCCASGSETTCAKTCAEGSRVCQSAAECGGKPCQSSKTCPFGTCGPLPAGCP